MSTKEQKIFINDKGRYPFKGMSDEYFNHLTARIMAQIPEEESEETVKASNDAADSNGKNTGKDQKVLYIVPQHKKQHRLWISIVSIAASFVLIVAVALKFIAIPSSSMSDQSTLADEQIAEYTADNYNEDLMTYTMADNVDVYCYLSAGGYCE